jgi:hypothetical protein
VPVVHLRQVHAYLLAIICASLILTPLAIGNAKSGLDVNDDEDFTVLGFVAGRTKLATIEAKLGQAKHFQARRHLDPLRMICYVSSGADHTQVIFTAFAADDQLVSIQVTAGNVKVDWLANCAITEQIAEDTAAAVGLKLGSSKSSVIDRLGPPEPHRFGHSRLRIRQTFDGKRG